MEIRWFGHSAFEIVSEENLKILIDPFISNNPSCQVAVEDIGADVILLTHGHADHFGDAMEIADRSNALLIANHELSIFLAQQGFETVGMNTGGSSMVQNIKITMVDAQHSSDIDFMEEVAPGGSAAGFIIQLENGYRIYHAGDTGLFGDMKQVIGEIFKPDMAILPIGDRFTMDPEAGAIAAQWIYPQKVIPMHYNTFPIIQQDPEHFVELVKSKSPDIDVVILKPGEIYQE
ncbi:MAG: metal-dependent hydrolase [Euryarchaeota archaeon]|nr:metal-dependent hydrolase [Euryarchaeota archaeon]MBV1730544.1 metal-dependent hydrolase [Methanobacterium sp.]MBU4548078.1 metal-dependent hydrolase [Euryarchaeota archaeon]MBU4608047.1 metal-dependent hydrolase [Euryarchaeota archaeon]MBV1755345.1 metal-dependent hydrolase [Methanobacterium sp.]